MDPVLALMVAGCVLVPALAAFLLGWRGRFGLAGVLVGIFALAGIVLFNAASQRNGMDGLGQMILAIGAALATGGAAVGLVAGALWRR